MFIDEPVICLDKRRQQKQNSIRSIPIRRLATTQEQSNGILFLLSSFSKYITGSSINIDGGQI